VDVSRQTPSVAVLESVREDEHATVAVGVQFEAQRLA